LLLAVISFTKRMSDIIVTEKALPDRNNKFEKIDAKVVNEARDCPQISIYNVEGPLFFGAAQAFEHSVMKTIDLKPRVLLFRMGKVPFMDTTGEQYFSSIVKHFSKTGIVLISGMKPQPRDVIRNSGLEQFIGKEHFFEHTGEAINYALTQLDRNKCVGCKHFAFRECDQMSLEKENVMKKRSGTVIV
ncbi:STAS domain-containing protein, partial [Bacillaceae bacterium W0354]